jgi:hypothetical protein
VDKRSFAACHQSYPNFLLSWPHRDSLVMWPSLASGTDQSLAPLAPVTAPRCSIINNRRGMWRLRGSRVQTLVIMLTHSFYPSHRCSSVMTLPARARTLLVCLLKRVAINGDSYLSSITVFPPASKSILYHDPLAFKWDARCEPHSLISICRIKNRLFAPASITLAVMLGSILSSYADRTLVACQGSSLERV